MKQLHSFVFYALIAPAMTLGASSVLAERAADRKMGESGMQHQSYMDTTPAGGARASNLIGTDVKSTGDDDVGSVSDLIIDADGQVVAIVIGVGGFLGLGEKDVAISWDQVSRSGTDDDLELRINMTREQLDAAPEYQQ